MPRRPLPTMAAMLLLVVVLAACTAGDAGHFDRSQPPTSTTTSPALPAATTASCPPIPSRAAPDPARSRYTLDLDVSPVEGVVEGRERVVFTPDRDTDRLVLRLWPNGSQATQAPARLEAGPVAVDGRPATSTLDDATTLSVRAGAGFRARRPVDVNLTWRLTVPGPANDRVSRNGDALRLGSFFPILPWEPGVGWATEPPVSSFAEASTAPTADFDLTVNVPDGFDVLTGATRDPVRSDHFTASAMRDVALSVGRFDTTSAVAMAPQPVRVTVGVQGGLADSAATYLERAVESIEDYGRRFGAYPWPVFTLAVTPNLGGGIEYPGHVMQGSGTLGVTGHEVAHQWFYGLVGNDQGRDPWLDEGLATYANARYTGSLDMLKATAVPASAKNMVGQSMGFWADKRGAYQDGLYTQGAQALVALGDPALVDCALRVYVARNAYRIATQSDLVLAAAAVFPAAASTLAAYGVKG